MMYKAIKLLLFMQAKISVWFVSFYLLMNYLLIFIFSHNKIEDIQSVMESFLYSTSKIYLLVIGIVYPLMVTELYISRGLTRKQFFWAFTAAIGIVSLFLLFILTVATLFDGMTLQSALSHYLQMLLFYLIGWTAAVGFQFGKWYTAIPGVLSAVGLLYTVTAITSIFDLSDLTRTGSLLLLTAAMLLVLPRFVAQVPVKT